MTQASGTNWAAITTCLSLAIAAWAPFVAWRTLRATAKQAETAEHTRKLSIRPYVVAYTRQYAHQPGGTYLIVANNAMPQHPGSVWTRAPLLTTAATTATRIASAAR